MNIINKYENFRKQSEKKIYSLEYLALGLVG